MKASSAAWLLLVCSFLGVADSWYLSESALTGTPLVCNITALDGCNIVAQSPYSHLFGIPLALYGVVFYALVFVFAAATLYFRERWIRTTLLYVSIAAFIASVIFVLIQVFLIQALCVYCLGSAALSVLILVFAMVLSRREPPAPLIPADVLS